MHRVLQIPAFRRLLTAYALNELALSVGSFALAVLVYRRTGSAVGAAAFFLSAQFVPALIAPALVARLDHRSARSVLPVLYGLEAVAFVALALIAKHFALAPLLVLALVDGVFALTARALARAATVAVTAPVGLLREGNAISNSAFSVCFMAGPAIGAGVVAVGGTIAALLANSGLFVVIAMTLATAPGLPGAPTERPGGPGRLRAAISHARRQPAIKALLSLQAVALLFFTITIPVEVVFALHVLRVGQGGYGALLATWGAGTVAGSLVYARWRSWSARVLISLGSGALAVGFLLMAVAPALAPALVGAGVAGCGNGIEAVAARTALQEHVEADWMAMMMSLNDSLYQAVPGGGILIGGALASLASPRLALAVAGGGALVVTAVAWVVLRPGGALEVPEPPAAGEEPDVPGSRSAPAAAGHPVR